MAELKEIETRKLSPAQAAELSLLVDLEARWENLRKNPSPSGEAGPLTHDLQGRQKAYEAFRAKLAAYNKRYTPAHVPELLLNTPLRLGLWCRRMKDLFLQVENDPPGRCPVHLVEKAYRWAERVSLRLHRDPLSHTAPPATMREAIDELEVLSQWCEDLGRVAVSA